MALTSVYSIRCLPATCPLLGHAEAAPRPRCAAVTATHHRVASSTEIGAVGHWAQEADGSDDA